MGVGNDDQSHVSLLEKNVGFEMDWSRDSGNWSHWYFDQENSIVWDENSLRCGVVGTVASETLAAEMQIAARWESGNI